MGFVVFILIIIILLYYLIICFVVVGFWGFISYFGSYCQEFGYGLIYGVGFFGKEFIVVCMKFLVGDVKGRSLNEERKFLFNYKDIFWSQVDG